MNGNLKVSFYLKRERKKGKAGNGDNPVYPIVGKIAIGRSIAQFGTKLKVTERLWHVKSGRATGKSHAAVALNREINRINLGIHQHYRELTQRAGNATAVEVKNAFQGIASAQKTLIDVAQYRKDIHETFAYISQAGISQGTIAARPIFRLQARKDNQ